MGSTLKGTNLLPKLVHFRVDTFSEGLGVQYSKQKVTTVVSFVRNGGIIRSVSVLLKVSISLKNRHFFLSKKDLIN